MRRKLEKVRFALMLVVGALLFPVLNFAVKRGLMSSELAIFLLDPSFSWSFSVPAGQTFNPLDGWQYEYLPYPAKITILHRAVLTGMLVTITSGSDTLAEESPVRSGGTAGVIPSAFEAPPITDDAAAGDRLKIRYRNTNAGANNIDGSIEIIPLIG